MGSFKEYLKENEELLAQIYSILDEMGLDEISDFGEFLYNEFFDGDWEYTDEEDEEMDFCLDEVKEMIDTLGPDMYEDILDLLEPEELDLDDDFEEELEEATPLQMIKSFLGKKLFHKNYVAALEMMKETGRTAADIARIFGHVDARTLDQLASEMNEGVSRRMKTSSMNRKSRKYYSLSKTKFKQGKASRKKAARQNKAAAKRYYRANKKKIAAYQKSRRVAIKSGKHKVKVRKG